MDKTIKIDDQVFKILDLKTINRVICQTDKGTLSLQIRKGEKNYHLVLDAVPLSKEDNKTLMDLLFPLPKPQEVPQVTKEPMSAREITHPIMQEVIKDIKEGKSIIRNKKIGRPQGSKTGVRME